MFLAELLALGHRSLAVIGLGKNAGKTFTLNQLSIAAKRLGLKTAVTSVGLDGEERDRFSGHPKPKIMISPGQVVVNAKTLLWQSGLDYEILGTTGLGTPWGEIILARAQSGGQTVLAGPGTAAQLAAVQGRLEQLGLDLLLVDGAVDRRSPAAPLLTDTAILAVGVEAAWERPRLLEKVRLQHRILTLAPWENRAWAPSLEAVSEEIKVVVLWEGGEQDLITHRQFFQNGPFLSKKRKGAILAVFVRGALTDAVLAKILEEVSQSPPCTVLVSDPTNVFLSKQSFSKLQFHQILLQVLHPLRLSAVTVNPRHSRYGYADPGRLLADVGRTVEPTPCLDLALGLRYWGEEDGHAIFES